MADETEMEYTKLGSTGLEVSRLCMGCAGLGSGGDWQVGDRDESIELVNRAIDAGINFFDTANSYGNGESERILGEEIDGQRDELVVATKVHSRVRDGPNGQGLSRKHVLEQVEKSLDRLDTDYLDLYYIHRWDDNTPIEETLSAFNYLIEEGKTRYIGASTTAAWKLMKALSASERNGYEQFVTIQPEYSLVARHEERNMLQVARDQGLGVSPWSPLGSGFLTGEYSRADQSQLESGENSWRDLTVFDTDDCWRVLDVVRDLAEQKDATVVQVSLAWLLHKDVVDAPIIGPASTSHLKESLGALDVSLTEDEIARLEEPIDPVWPLEAT